MQSKPRHGHPAFSLVEMITVIAIIVILASLVIGSLGFVNERKANARAKVQIALLSNALEEYKKDNGYYPPPDTNTPKGEKNSKFLFRALYFEGANDPTGKGKVYVPELDPATNKHGWTSGTASAETIIVDPWGKEYRYRTHVDKDGNVNSDTQNPDFDLWSMGKDGDTNPSTPGEKVNRDDIKNF